MTTRAAVAPLGRGFATALPLVPGTLAWGAAFGAAAAAVGLRPQWSLAMSGLAWSGTAQMAALAMLAQPLPLVFLSSLLLSLRFVPMSLALAGMLPEAPRWRRVLAACCIADASFALVAAGPARSVGVVVGTWLAQYPAWLAGTAAGALAAPLLPSRLLEASSGLVAVIFAVLAVEACRSRRDTGVAVIAAAGVAGAMLVLPGSIALPLVAVLATALGVGRWR